MGRAAWASEGYAGEREYGASQQVRKVRFEGECMIVVPPERDQGGVKIHRELIWERISTVSL